MSLDNITNINIDDLTLFIEENTVVNVPVPTKLGDGHSKIIVTNYISIGVPEGTRIIKGNNIYAVVNNWKDADSLSKIPNYDCVFKQTLAPGSIIIDNCGIKRKLEFDLDIEIPKNTSVIIPIGTKLQNVDMIDDCTQQQKVCEDKFVNPSIEQPMGIGEYPIFGKHPSFTLSPKEQVKLKDSLSCFTEYKMFIHRKMEESKKEKPHLSYAEHIIIIAKAWLAYLKSIQKETDGFINESSEEDLSTDYSDDDSDYDNDSDYDDDCYDDFQKKCEDDSEDNSENDLGKEQDQNILKYDFANMTCSDIAGLDLENQELLDQVGMESFPVYDELSEDEQYMKYKAYFVKMLIMASIVENRRNDTFKKLKNLHPSGTN